MPFMLIRREDKAFVVGAEERYGCAADVMIEVAFDTLVQGTKVSDWPEGMHDLPDNPSMVSP
jgi:hypothetical protein